MLGKFFLDFAFYYPLTMAWFWIFGALNYFLRRERTGTTRIHPPELAHWPKATLVVPCHNEGDNVRETVGYLAEQDYPDFEIIAVNDGSRDNTGAILKELTLVYPQLRVLHFRQNQGKAMGLRMAALASNSEFMVCIDGDALLDRYATRWLIWHLVTGPRVGAVTGNPRIRNRSTLLGRVQVGEFSSIIGLIKRAQRIYGTLHTISGVIAAFRRSALQRCGYWSLDMITDDIDVSWLLQADHWSIQYEPDALCWILMPETFKGLWKQRLRWAQGGAEVYLKQLRTVWQWNRRRMWGLFIEYSMSIAWCLGLVTTVVLWAIGKFVAMPEGLNVPSIQPPVFWGLFLATTCLIQFTVAMVIESRYEKQFLGSIIWVIWYPFFFWIITLITSLVGFPKALFRKRDKRAVWANSDRGVA